MTKLGKDNLKLGNLSKNKMLERFCCFLAFTFVNKVVGK